MINIKKIREEKACGCGHSDCKAGKPTERDEGFATSGREGMNTKTRLLLETAFKEERGHVLLVETKDGCEAILRDVSPVDIAKMFASVIQEHPGVGEVLSKLKSTKKAKKLDDILAEILKDFMED